MSMILHRLEFTLNTVNGWLKFAEAKNAALLTLSIGVFSIVTNCIISKYNIGELLLFCLKCSLIPLFLSTMICLASFLPVLDWMYVILYKEKKIQSTQDNLQYFGDLRHYTSNDLLNQYVSQYSYIEDNIESKKECLDFCGQIIVNSSIANKKYVFFTWSTWMFYISTLLQSVGIFLETFK